LLRTQPRIYFISSILNIRRISFLYRQNTWQFLENKARDIGREKGAKNVVLPFFVLIIPQILDSWTNTESTNN